jgi:hypothetical protein
LVPANDLPDGQITDTDAARLREALAALDLIRSGELLAAPAENSAARRKHAIALALIDFLEQHLRDLHDRVDGRVRPAAGRTAPSREAVKR